MRREFADSGESAARFDNVLDVARRQRFAGSEISSGNIRLKNVSVIASGFRVFSVYPVGFQIIVNHLFDILW